MKKSCLFRFVKRCRAVQTARDKNLYLTFSFLFFSKDSIANESQLTIGEMYIRPYFYRSWRSFDERFFSGFILLFVFADCDHLPIALYAIWSLEEERESERESKIVEKIFTRIARCVFSLELSTILFHGLWLEWIRSVFFFLFSWNSILLRSLLLALFILNIVVWRYNVLW